MKLVIRWGATFLISLIAGSHTFAGQSLLNCGASLRRNNDDHLPFKIIIDSPVERLRTFYRNQERFSQDYLELNSGGKSGDHEVKSRKYQMSREALAELTDLLRNAISSSIELTELVLKRNLSIHLRVSELYRSLEDYSSQFEGELKIIEESHSHTTEQNSDTLRRQLIGLIGWALQEWPEMLSKNVSLTEIVKVLRKEDIKDLESLQFQRILQKNLLDALQLMTFRAFTYLVMSTKTSPYKEYTVRGYFEQILPGWHGIHTVYESEQNSRRRPLKFEEPYSLFSFLISEIVNNSNEATSRRKGSLDWNTHARVRAEEIEGVLKIEIEDFGEPSEYQNVQGVGGTSNTVGRIGVGIGRFYIYMLSSMMGFEYNLKAKADQSGSVATLMIPIREHNRVNPESLRMEVNRAPKDQSVDGKYEKLTLVGSASKSIDLDQLDIFYFGDSNRSRSSTVNPEGFPGRFEDVGLADMAEESDIILTGGAFKWFGPKIEVRLGRLSNGRPVAVVHDNSDADIEERVLSLKMLSDAGLGPRFHGVIGGYEDRIYVLDLLPISKEPRVASNIGLLLEKIEIIERLRALGISSWPGFHVDESNGHLVLINPNEIHMRAELGRPAVYNSSGPWDFTKLFLKDLLAHSSAQDVISLFDKLSQTNDPFINELIEELKLFYYLEMKAANPGTLLFELREWLQRNIKNGINF